MADADIVRFSHIDEDGNPQWDATLSLPECEEHEREPSERMVQSVADLFGLELAQQLKWSQASMILAARDYARQVAEVAAPAGPAYDLFVKFGIILILKDDQMRADIRKWSDRRYKQNVEGSNITRTKHFDRMATYFRDIKAQATAAGYQWGHKRTGAVSKSDSSAWYFFGAIAAIIIATWLLR